MGITDNDWTQYLVDYDSSLFLNRFFIYLCLNSLSKEEKMSTGIIFFAIEIFNFICITSMLPRSLTLAR